MLLFICFCNYHKAKRPNMHSALFLMHGFCNKGRTLFVKLLSKAPIDTFQPSFGAKHRAVGR